jgi:hypothetical protein
MQAVAARAGISASEAKRVLDALEGVVCDQLGHAEK